MKNLAISLIMPAFLLASCQPNAPSQNTAAEKEDVRDGIFIHLSKGPEDAHRVGMAFKMAELMSDDKDVAMYLDIEAVNLVVQGAPDVAMDGFPSSHEQIKKLAEAGVIIQACPACLKVAGYSEEDLMDGIILADKEKFFTFTKGKILTIDY
jgi:predicted peroxiredoxin